MPKRKRPARIPAPLWESRPRITLGALRTENRWQLAAFAGIVLLVLAAVGFAVYGLTSDWLERQGRPGQSALKVEDVTYDLGYYTNRLRLYVQQVGGAGSVSASPETAIPLVAETIIEEQLVRQFAGELGASVTPEELDQAIRQRIGLGSSITPPAEETAADTATPAADTPPPAASPTADPFPSAYQQELERTGLSDEEYRQMVEAQVLIGKLRSKFSEELPDTTESVHYRQILVQDESDADDIVARVRGGEDFGEIAKRESQDTNTRADGGDVGWVPRGLLDPSLEDVLFALNEGDVDKYVIPTTDVFSRAVYVFQVLEKEENREIEPQRRASLAGRAYRDWLDEKRQAVEVVNHMDLVSGDGDKIGWAVRQVYGG